MSTVNGIGTKFLGFGYRNRDGSHYATQWFVVLDLPILPLRRYRLTVGADVHHPLGAGSRTLTRYVLHEETRLDSGEIMLTYLTWWLLGPLVVAGPAALLLWAISGNEHGGLGFWAFFLSLSLAWVVGTATAMTNYGKRRHGLPR
ncbi:hypothetical protein [Streptomyces gilvus]|uniref:hypothetical protein n=1 Tax=Streptomyces gilvus TaxID=2920937 RepID=UPI001F0FD43F|nr:hypothetical protein [Streptomyces sp. CME 23]MCH5670424.1 hypothetical protein [Streptomyces sp. CME 23]